jgi:hypothetical protein
METRNKGRGLGKWSHLLNSRENDDEISMPSQQGGRGISAIRSAASSSRIPGPQMNAATSVQQGGRGIRALHSTASSSSGIPATSVQQGSCGIRALLSAAASSSRVPATSVREGGRGIAALRQAPPSPCSSNSTQLATPMLGYSTTATDDLTDSDDSDEDFQPADEDEDYLSIHFDDDDDDEDDDDDNDDEPSSQSSIRKMENGQPVNFSDKHGWEWTTVVPNQRVRRDKANVIRQTAGPTRAALAKVKLEEPETFFFLFINAEMQERILAATNAYCSVHVTNWQPLTPEELQAFFGLLIHMGATHWRNENVTSMWSVDNENTIFRATMSRRRFQTISRYIRFEFEEIVDAEREKGNRVAYIQWIWANLVKNLQEMFTPGEYLSLDEMLSLYRGRTCLKVFIKSKPGKYGFKIVLVTDAYYRYVCNARLFVPKGMSRGINAEGFSCGGTPVDKQVNEILQPYFHSGRNVTMDRFFSHLENSVLLHDEKQITVVGTVMSSRRHVPKELTLVDNRSSRSSIFGFHDSKLMLVSHCPCKGKVVLVHSTLHLSNEVANDELNKPEVIHLYNKTKGGVDSVDQMARHLSVKRQTRRWPTSLFFTMVDMAMLNAYAIRKTAFPDSPSRRQFYLDVGKRLCMKQMLSRQADRLPGSIQRSILKQTAGNVALAGDESAGESNVMACRQCQEDTGRRRVGVRRTTVCCFKCHKGVCKDHQVVYCTKCAFGDDNLQ